MSEMVKLNGERRANPRTADADLVAALVAVLAPLVRRVVREEVERAGMQWRWRNVKQVAEILGISESAVWARCNRGQEDGRPSLHRSRRT
jgi:hypothetical protein